LRFESHAPDHLQQRSYLGSMFSQECPFPAQFRFRY
jgi:hypothetical protein